MSNRTIYVSRKNSTSHKLKLRDSEGNNPGTDKITTLVDTGDEVTWQLDEDSGLSAITDVKKKKHSDQLLRANPSVNNGKWNGTVVAVSPGIGKKEKYEIHYKILNNDQEYHDDPVLQMKN